MKFAKGTTRYVVVIGKIAIKIGRIKFFRFILRVILFPFLGHRWKLSMKEALCVYFGNGIECNRNEHGYWQETHDPEVMPVLASLARGFVIIQDCGTCVTQRELESECPLYGDMKDDLPLDMRNLPQYCRHPNGKIRLVDYGTRLACGALLRRRRLRLST